MVNDQKFLIKNLKNVILLGCSKLFPEMKNINSHFGIKTHIITAPDQKKNLISKDGVHVFKKIDKKFKNFIKNNVDVNETLFLSIGCRWIFSKESINILFKNNLVNFHGTRLPYDQGGADISWKILRNDRIDNQLVHLIDGDIDTGPILMNKSRLTPHECKIPIDFINYHDANQIIFYKEFITKLKNGDNFSLKHQVDYIGRYNPRLNTDISGWINWSTSSVHLSSFINAFDEPYKGASTFINGKKVRIKSATLHGGDTSNHPFMSGIISRHDKNWLVVSTSDQSMILIEKVINEKNKNIMSELKPGDRFYTPSKNIDYAFSKAIKYNSFGLKN
tara:strand:- start:43 stop:1044 length:1002 start_codon:yes stop_codon:yes gene_type:complete